MDKKEELEKLTIEKEYYRIEFLEKQKQNKKNFSKKIFLDFIACFDKSNFSVNHQEKKVEISDIKTKYSMELVTDIDSNPKEPLIFQINKFEKSSGNFIEYLMRPFNDSPMPNPDFNRLKKNPYKGMDLLDIELVEEQKNIDFFKKYIQDNFRFEDYVFSCQYKLTDESFGEFDTIEKIFDQIG